MERAWSVANSSSRTSRMRTVRCAGSGSTASRQVTSTWTAWELCPAFAGASRTPILTTPTAVSPCRRASIVSTSRAGRLCSGRRPSSMALRQPTSTRPKCSIRARTARACRCSSLHARAPSSTDRTRRSSTAMVASTSPKILPSPRRWRVGSSWVGCSPWRIFAAVASTGAPGTKPG